MGLKSYQKVQSYILRCEDELSLPITAVCYYANRAPRFFLDMKNISKTSCYSLSLSEVWEKGGACDDWRTPFK